MVGHAESWGAHFGEDYAHYFNRLTVGTMARLAASFLAERSMLAGPPPQVLELHCGAIGAAAVLERSASVLRTQAMLVQGCPDGCRIQCNVDVYQLIQTPAMVKYGLAVTFGGLNPLGGMSGLAVGGGFAGVTALAGGDSAAAKRAFMAGDLIGGIFGGGADDVLKAIGKGAKFAYAMDHARRFARFQAGGAAIGGAIGWRTAA